PLDRLAAYTTGQDARSLLQPVGGLIVPLLVGTDVRCAVFLKFAESSYTGVGLGQPHMTRLIEESIAAVAKDHNTPSQSLVVVKIPGLFLTFVARSANEQTWLTPVTSTPTWDLRAGQELAASIIFARLQPAAKNNRPSSFSGQH